MSGQNAEESFPSAYNKLTAKQAKQKKQMKDDHTASKVVDINHNPHDLNPLQTGEYR